LRIISGKARGKKLISPKDQQVRPTSDRVKEAIFSSIHDKIFNSTFLDLFCGSGQIGIEALSRGAKFCTFVDSSKESIDLTKKNLDSLKGIVGYQTIHKQVKDALEGFASDSFDIIFLDPPYNSIEIDKILDIIATKGILKNKGIIIIEKGVSTPLSVPDVLIVQKTKKYADTNIVILEVAP